MLQNISLRYDPVEDRLVLRLTLKSEAGAPVEHWLHLTRRVCAAWRQDLQAMVDLSARLPERMDRAARAAVSSAHHHALSAQVPTRTEPPPPASAEPAVTPLLVTGIVCGRRRSDGRWVVRFELRGRSPLGLVLSDPTLHAVVDAVSRRIQSAAWSLPAIAAERTAPERSPDAPLH